MLARLATVLPNLFNSLQQASARDRFAAVSLVCRCVVAVEVGTDLQQQAMTVLSACRMADTTLLAALASEVEALDEAYFERDAACRDDRTLALFRRARLGAALCFALEPTEDA